MDFPSSGEGGPFAKLAEEVTANGNVLVCRVERLRDAAGYSKLGRYVVGDIEDGLRRNGLGWRTQSPIDNAAKQALLYTLGTKAEAIVRAVMEPTPDGAAVLRSVVNEPAEETLKRIKALVCD